MESREIVYYHEQHTLMTQDVTVLIEEGMLKKMLEEDLSPSTKRELIQTYYVCALKKSVKINSKNNYGDWNAQIGEIQHIYFYEKQILDKLKSQVTTDELNKQFKLININILALSEKEIADTVKVQNKMLENFIQKLSLPKHKKYSIIIKQKDNF